MSHDDLVDRPLLQTYRDYSKAISKVNNEGTLSSAHPPPLPAAIPPRRRLYSLHLPACGGPFEALRLATSSDASCRARLPNNGPAYSTPSSTRCRRKRDGCTGSALDGRSAYETISRALFLSALTEVALTIAPFGSLVLRPSFRVDAEAPALIPLRVAGLNPRDAVAEQNDEKRQLIPEPHVQLASC